MEVLEFVKSSEVDAVYLESSYYMAPDDAGEKPYALLFEALKKSGFVAIAKLTMHSREHIVVLRPGRNGMLLHTMYYEDEVRKVEEFRTDTSLVKDKELELAMTLIQSLSAEFEPAKYKDTYRENLMALIQAKVQGRQIVQPPEAQHLAPVIDIMEALKASLAAGKKPVRSAAVADTSATESVSANSAKPKRNKKSAAGG
jgi:DNA end-binding protein Ku